MRGPLQEPGEKEGQEEGAAAVCGCPAGVPEAKKGSDADSDSDQETEGAYWQGVGAGWGRVGRGPRPAGAHPSVGLGAALALCLPHHAPGVPSLEQASRMRLRGNPPHPKQRKKGCLTRAIRKKTKGMEVGT